VSIFVGGFNERGRNPKDIVGFIGLQSGGQRGDEGGRGINTLTTEGPQERLLPKADTFLKSGAGILAGRDGKGVCDGSKKREGGKGVQQKTLSAGKEKESVASKGGFEE